MGNMWRIWFFTDVSMIIMSNTKDSRFIKSKTGKTKQFIQTWSKLWKTGQYLVQFLMKSLMNLVKLLSSKTQLKVFGAICINSMFVNLNLFRIRLWWYTEVRTHMSNYQLKQIYLQDWTQKTNNGPSYQILIMQSIC